MDDALLVAVVNGVTDLAEELSEAAVYYRSCVRDHEASTGETVRIVRVVSGTPRSCTTPSLIGKFLKHCGLWQQPSWARLALRARRGLCRVIAHTGAPFTCLRLPAPNGGTSRQLPT